MYGSLARRTATKKTALSREHRKGSETLARRKKKSNHRRGRDGERKDAEISISTCRVKEEGHPFLMAGLADLAAQVRVQYWVVCCRCALSGRLVIEWAEWLVLWVPSTATGILVNAKISEPNQERREIVGYREHRSLVGPVRLDSGDSVGFTLGDVIIVRRTGAHLSALPRRERRQGWCRTFQDSMQWLES